MQTRPAKQHTSSRTMTNEPFQPVRLLLCCPGPVLGEKEAHGAPLHGHGSRDRSLKRVHCSVMAFRAGESDALRENDGPLSFGTSS